MKRGRDIGNPLNNTIKSPLKNLREVTNRFQVLEEEEDAKDKKIKELEDRMEELLDTIDEISEELANLTH